MGTDIHMGAEVFDRSAGRWVNTGRVFDSDRDWDYRPITRELLNMLDAPTLLQAFAFHVTHEEYGKDMAPYLSESVIEVFRRWDSFRATQRHDLEAHRAKVSAEGWDYGKVKPFEDAQKREARAAFLSALDDKQRQEVVEAALGYANDYRERYKDEEYEATANVNLERWPDDPPFKSANPYQNRNYNAFSVLGNVRNGYGFAGVDTGDPIKPLTDRRGVPDDADDATLALLSNEHSASWCTLAELEGYDYDAGKVNCGVVSEQLYEIMKAVGQDDPYHPDVLAERERRDPTCNKMDVGVSGWISGAGIVTFDAPGYEHWVARGRPLVQERNPLFSAHEQPVDEQSVATQVAQQELDGSHIRAHIQVRWMTTIRDQLGENFFSMISQLRNIVPDGGSTNDVRIVFDFDS